MGRVDDPQKDSPYANQKDNFGSSFRPIFTLLRCFGVDVQWGEQRSQRRQLLAHFIFIFWSFVNTAIVILNTGRKIDMLVGKPRKEVIKDAIDTACALVQIVGIFFAFVLATKQHGHQLFEAFQRLEIHFPNDGKILNRIRRVSILTVVIILATVVKKLRT